MPRLRLARLLVALTATALLVPTLAAPATAAKVPEVPSLAKAAKIYPHVKDGTLDTYPMETVEGPGKKCDSSKKIKGATGNIAIYSGEAATEPTAKKPQLMLNALRFSSAKSAKKYLNSLNAFIKKCGVSSSTTAKAKVTTFKVKLGDQSWGATVKAKEGKTHYATNVVGVRKGKHLISAIVTATGKKAPAVKKTIKFAKLALNAAS